MKKTRFTYHLYICFLLGSLLWPCGKNSLCAQTISYLVGPDSLTSPAHEIRRTTPVTDSIQTPADTLRHITDKQTIIPDSIILPEAKELQDSASIVRQTDSLLNLNHYKKEKRFIPDPQRALWLSLIIPGAGQIYNRKLWKIPIVYGGFLGCLYALTWNNQMYSDYSQAYLDIMDDDPNTKSYMNMLPLNYDITGKEDQYKDIFKNKKNYYRKYRDMSIFAMIGVYLLSVVDAYVDAELSSFDISKDLGLKIEPAIFNSGRNMANSSVGVQCKLNF